MLSVILYDQIAEVDQLEFISQGSIKVITPNPHISDAFRLHYQGHGRNNRQVDVITISKFTSELLQRFAEDVVVKRKAQLLLELSIVWRIKAPDLSYAAFVKTFNTLTDLRSYSLELEMFEQVFEEFDPEEAQMLKLFWLYMDQANLVDEHKAYTLLVEMLGGNQIEDNETIVLWGFSHLSGIQIDLFKTLAQSLDIFIPFPRKVYAHSKNTDWVHWLEVEDEGGLPEEKEKINARLIDFDSNRMNSWINKSDVDMESPCQVLLLEKNPSLRQIGEIPLDKSSFRVAQDIFSTVISKLFYEIQIGFNQDEISIQDLVNWTKEKLKRELEKGLYKKNFRLIKVYGILLDNILLYGQMTDQKTVIDNFDLKLLKELVTLASPRTFAATINEEQANVKIFGLESVEALNKKVQKIICLTKQYRTPSSERVQYSEKMAEFLATIAPVRSQEMENRLLQFKLEDIVKEDPTTLFLIENGILEKNIGWIRLFENFEFEKMDQQVSTVNLTSRDFLKDVIKQNFTPKEYWSATRLQTYQDCPRKYYFDYIEKLETPRQLLYEILPMDLGTLEHAIIEKYLGESKVYEEQVHQKIVQETLAEFLNKNANYAIRKIDLENYLHELRIFSAKAIIELLKISQIDGTRIFLEVSKWADRNIKGSIDCIVKMKDGFFILDFKRSKNQIVSLGAFEEFKKIQLWFYQNHVDNRDLGKFYGMGYLTLGDLSKSTLYVDQEIKADLEAVDFLAYVKKRDIFDSQKFEEYRNFEKELIERAQNDKIFAPIPLEKQVCLFCNVKNLCPKSEVSGE